MAVTGVNPQPMSKNDPWRKFYDYLPKAASVDDGEMIVCEVGKYKPNPWGLYDIHEMWKNGRTVITCLILIKINCRAPVRRKWCVAVPG